MADAKDLKSFGRLLPCGFESRSGYCENACLSTTYETHTKTLDVLRVRRFFVLARHLHGRSVQIWCKSLSAKPYGSGQDERMAEARTGRVRDGQRETIYSTRFNGTLTLASGKRTQEPLTDDKTSSLALLNRLQREQDDKRARGHYPSG